jgi:hypothetical protein
MRQPAVVCLALLFAFSWGVREAFGAPAPAVAVYSDAVNGRGSVTLIDRESYAVLGTAELDQLPLPLGFDATGRSLLVMSLPKTVDDVTGFWIVDAESAASTLMGYAALATSSYAYDPDVGRLYLAVGTENSKTISAFDLVARKRLAQLASVERMTALQVAPDGALLYAICEGRTHKKPKGPPGNLHVLDAVTGAELARIDAGQNASSVVLDVKRGLAYVMGVANQEGDGTLTVLRGASVVARLRVLGRPIGLRFGPDGGSYLLTRSAVIALAADGLAARHTWDLSFWPSDLIFDPGHDLMYAGARFGSRIAEMKMSGGRVIAEHATGSPGLKFGYGLANTLVGIVAVAGAVGGGISTSSIATPTTSRCSTSRRGTWWTSSPPTATRSGWCGFQAIRTSGWYRNRGWRNSTRPPTVSTPRSTRRSASTRPEGVRGG